MYNRFKKELLKDEKTVVAYTVDELLLKRSVKSANAMAILFILLNMYHIIRSLVIGEFIKINFFAEIFSILSSVVFLAISQITKTKNNKICMRVSLVLYYLCITADVAMLSYGVYTFFPQYLGIPLSSLFFFAFMVLPLNGMIDSIIVLTSMFAELLMIHLLHTSTSLFIQLIMRIVIAVSYFYFRHKNYVEAENEIEYNSVNQILLRYSYVDMLTNTLNRYAFEIYLKELFKQADNTIGIIMFDVDNFKSYNDYYSHNDADTVLVQITQAVAAKLGDKDKYIFRYGGEEFQILVDGADNEEILEIAKKYCAAVYDECILREDVAGVDRVTISIGVKNNITPEKYLRDVDEQLYNAKSKGKNCISFDNKIYKI